ncbi:Arp5p [Sugiyamaella lignohabitans]|uniref:Arp5p n=1 Tax=Sugiyamaella lignohabitans TaxID=796027 RepID=A0A161HKV4_9ASCO|nr:Arp5p [Sugiyamaella lignohabitans]ANB13777.1 Arp5p [Sugiyamaella lignohabitans]
MPPSIDSVKVEEPVEEFAPVLYPLRDIEKPEAVEPITGGWKEGVPIAIDFGSYQTRIGYANEESPSHEFFSQVSKFRDRRANRSYTLVGNDIYLDATARQSIKSPFDGPLISNWDATETILDYSFAKLSVGSRNGVENPIVMTEILGAPEPQRKFMNELLFEGYNVPSLTYGIDSLFSFHYNQGVNVSDSSHTGIVVSCGHEATHIIPVIKGRGILSQAKRINWGGRQASSYLQALLALKYPYFPTKVTPSQATYMIHDHCYVSSDYPQELSNYLEYSTMSTRERIIQAPFTEVVVQEKSEEELARIAEQRKESGRRLQEQAAKKRLEKLVQQEQELEYYNELKNRIASAPNKKEVKRMLDGEGIKDEAALQKTISELEKTIRRGRKQDVGDDTEEQVAPSFPLVEIPDEDLDEEQIKEKRRQRLLKASYDARMRAKEEKLLEEQRLAEEARKDDEWREADLEGWIKEKRDKLDGLLANVREKERLREELSNRKSHASQMRMKSIAVLASDSRGGNKRRRAAGAGDDDPDDTFGANDDDWAVYRRIANASDSEEEEEEKNTIKALQEQLLQHDPTFSIEDTREAQLDWRKSTIHMFLRGPHEFDPESRAQSHQLNLNVERIRVPEVLFQPSIAGVDQAGIVEVCGDILLRNKTIPYANNLFLHGGQAHFPNFEDRLFNELRAILPVNTSLSVKRASNLSFDAWRGMAQWSLTDDFRSSVVTREDYLEMGSGYIKEHGFGNALVR